MKPQAVSSPSSVPPPGLRPLLERVRARAESAGVFGASRLAPDALELDAAGCPEPAFYRLQFDAGRLWVALATPHRYLSQSIEQDLVHTGDKMHELMDEELADLGHRGAAAPFEHFRNERKEFVFRTAVPVEVSGLGDEPGAHAVDTAARFLLACEATFRPLGDMAGAEDEE